MYKNLYISRLFLWLNILMLLMLIITGSFAIFYHQKRQELGQKREMRFQSFRLAFEMRQSSDELTRLARSYVTTGDPSYEKQYWTVLDVRNGVKPRPDGSTIALKTLMQQAGFTRQEFDKLQEAEDRSNALVQIERTAMNAVKGVFVDNNGNFTRYDKPDMEMARRLMFDINYDRQKSLILQPVQEFSSMLEHRTQQEISQASHDAITTLNLLMTMIGLLIVMVIVYYYIIRIKIIKPVLVLNQYSEKIARGDFGERIPIRSDNELGNLARALNTLSAAMKSKSDFVYQIGQGNLNVNVEVLSEQDGIGISLMKMKENLQRIAEEDRKRNWVTEGLARFADILRSSDDTRILSDNILSSLVKYTGANQGGLYLVNGREGQEYLQLTAAYAFDRKKYHDQKIVWGEGLVGRAWQEKSTLFLTDVPNGYVHITSGLGGENPRCILIVPLVLNDEVQGVIELASFHVFEPHEVGFVEKLAENIASTLSFVKINERTRKLLTEAQVQEELMKTQEEEMRQNLEELQATQEEMVRKEMQIRQMLDEANTREEELRANLDEIHYITAELEEKKTQIEYIKEEEARRAKEIQDNQKKLMTRFIEQMKAKEQTLQEQLAGKEKEIEALRQQVGK